jgi:branched-chain amino acid aminotransferase
MSKLERPDYLWFNGKICPWNEGNVHVWSEVATRGANVFEGIRCYTQQNGSRSILSLDAHMDRLYDSAKLLHFTPGFSKEEMIHGIHQIIRKIPKGEHVYIRPTIYVEYGRYGKLYGDDEYGAYVVAFPTPRGESVTKGVTCCISTWKHSNDLIISPRIKAGASYQAYRLPVIEARSKQFDEAILLNQEDYVTETTGAAVFIVKGNKLITPPLSAGILDSITRKHVMEIAKKRLDMEVLEENITRIDLYLANEAFAVGTLAEITPIVKIDLHELSNGKPGRYTKKIQEIYFDICEGRIEDKWNWLVPVEELEEN